MAMGNNITNIATVSLSASTVSYNFTANGISGLVVKDASSGIDTIAAGGTNQTLTGGGAGKETMIGFAGGGDTFKDTAALFNGDAIKNFAAAGDVLDVTDLNPATVAQPVWTQNTAASGTLSLTDGTHSASITLFGQFVAAGFHTAPDGSGTGMDITYQQPLQQSTIIHSPV